MRGISMPAGVLLLVVSGACADGGVFETPLVRVDLSSRLPAKARRTRIAATALECRKVVTLPAAGVSPRFAITWRVLDYGAARYIAAIEVAPASTARIEGVRNPSASASVGALTNVGPPEAAIASVPVQLHWSAQKGCETVSRGVRVVVRADDASCKKPKTPKLLRPVK